MNRYMLFTGICYAMSTPLGVHIGYLMGMDRWLQVLAELLILIALQTMAPVMWVKAQTLDLKESQAQTKKE